MNILEALKPIEPRYARSFHQEGRASMDKSALNKAMAFCRKEARVRETHNDIPKRHT